MKKIFIILLIVINSYLSAEYVDATGSGSSCSSAVNDALQNAVKSVAGAKIQSATQVKDGVLDYDKIFSSTDGLVKNYKEIEKKSESGYCEVTLKVNVMDEKVQESLDEFINSKSSMRMFQKTSFKDRSVMVLYSTRKLDGAFGKNTTAAQSLMDNLQNQLRSMEFDVVLEDGLEGMEIPQEDMMDEDAIKAANMIGADAIVLATLIHSGSEHSGENEIIYSNALIKAYDPSTKRLFANVNERSRIMSRAKSDFDLKDGFAKGAIKAGQSAAPKLVKEIVENLSVGSKKVIQVVIKNIPDDLQRTLRKALKNNEISFKVAKRQKSFVIFDVDTADTLTDFEDIFLDLWENEKIKGFPKTVSAAGSKIEFVWEK